MKKIIALLALMLIAVIIYTQVGKAFMPTMDEVELFVEERGGF